jgi:hypothetical protein
MIGKKIILKEKIFLIDCSIIKIYNKINPKKIACMMMIIKMNRDREMVLIKK